MRNLTTLSAIIEILSLVTWVGGMGSLALIAAPAIFEGASSRENAGRIFGLILKRFHRIGYGCGVAILIAGGLRYYGRFSHSLYTVEVIRYAIAATMLALTLYTGIVIARRLEGLRERMEGGIDRLAKDDPQRVEFNRLHRQSTGIMAFSLLLGITMAVLFGMEVY